MVMNVNPQIADDLSQVEDTVLAMATVAGEHMAVIERVSNRHTLPAHTGQTYRMAHVGKMEAMLGGPRTRWTQVQRYNARVYEVPLQYATAITKIGDDMKQFLSAKFLAQMGSQAGNAVTRVCDKVGLALFPTASNINVGGGGSASDKIKVSGLVQDMYAIQAAQDDSDSPMVNVMPTAYIRDLNLELLNLGTGTLTRPIPDGPTGKFLTAGKEYNWMGIPVMEARNSEKYGSAGYGATLRRSTIDFVTAQTMMKERVRDGFQGGGSWVMLIRKLFGLRISPWAYENWFRVQNRVMDIGGA